MEMKIQPIGEQAFLTAAMTFQAMRQENLLYKQIVERQKEAIEKLEEKIKELETELKDSRNFIP